MINLKKILVVSVVIFALLLVGIASATNYTFPQPGDTGWGTSLRNFFGQMFNLSTSWFIDPVVDVRNYNSLADAVSGIGSSTKTLMIASAVTVTTTVTFPSNLSVVVTKTGGITASGAGMLVINGQFQAGPYRVFTGFSSGGVTFGKGSVIAIYPQWWGAVGDGTTDDTAALNLAVAALAGEVSTLQSPRSTFYTTGTISLGAMGVTYNPVKIDWGNSTFEWHGTGTHPVMVINDNKYLTMTNFQIDGKSVANVIGLYLNSTSPEFTTGMEIGHFNITSCNIGLQVGEGSNQVSATRFHHYRINDCNVAVKIDSPNTDMLTFESATTAASTTHYQLTNFGLVKFRQVNAYGAKTNPGPSDMFFLEAWQAPVTIEECQSEGNIGDTLNFIKVVGYGGSSASAPLSLVNNAVDQKIWLSGSGGSANQTLNIRGGYTRDITIDVSDMTVNMYGVDTKATYTFNFNYAGVLNNYSSKIGAPLYSALTLTTDAKHINYQNLGTYSKTTSGYQKYPNGSIMQWGTLAVPISVLAGSSTSTMVTFPIPFPTATWRALATTSSNTTVGPLTVNLKTASTTTMGVQLFNGSSYDVDIDINYFVIGN